MNVFLPYLFAHSMLVVIAVAVVVIWGTVVILVVRSERAPAVGRAKYLADMAESVEIGREIERRKQGIRS